MVEHRFAELCSRERKDVNVMRELVKEHSTVQDEMKVCRLFDDESMKQTLQHSTNPQNHSYAYFILLSVFLSFSTETSSGR